MFAPDLKTVYLINEKIMSLIKWKFKPKENIWYGTVKGDKEPLISIQGRLCITDLRECRKSETWISPKHYKLNGISIEEAKQVAEDLVTGANFEIHEKNRLEWEAESERTSRLIQEADAFIKSLQEKNENNF